MSEIPAREVEEDSWKDSPRGVEAKEKEKVQRHFVGQVLALLADYHKDLRYRFTPDRKREVDVHIDTSRRTTRSELKANDSHFTYFHGDPEENTWSYEYNFIVRNASLIIGTQHTELPEDNTIPVVRTLSPKQLSELQEKSPVKLQTVITFTALELERELFPQEEWTLRASIDRSSMETNTRTITRHLTPCYTTLEVHPTHIPEDSVLPSPTSRLSTMPPPRVDLWR